MLIYGINLVLIGILHFIVYHVRCSKTHFLRLSLFYLFIISSLRDKSIGTDYRNYVEIFYWIISRGSSYVENGYVLLNKAVALFTHHYVGLAIAVNLMLFIPLYYFIKNRVPVHYWGLSIFVFTANPYMFVQATFNGLRQTCATGIVLIGMNVLLGKKKRKYSIPFFLLTIILAAQFHRAAYILAIIPVVLLIKWKRTYWFFITIASVIINLVGARLMAAAVVYFFGFNVRYVDFEASLLNNPVYVLFVVVVIFYLLSHYEAYTAMGPEKKRSIDFYLFSLCMLIMALPNDIIYRVYIMLSFCAIPGISAVCESTRPGFSRIRIKHEELLVERLYVLYYLFFNIGYIALLAINQNTSYVPFRFFFES